MSGTPFFSVIIPTFNRAHLLAKAIQSVLDQTFTDWELIVVDDGSTDETAAVVRSFGDGRIRYFFKDNEERSAARNHGIEHSCGIFISFLDDDDHYLKDFLWENHRIIVRENTPVCAIMSNEYALMNGKMTPGNILTQYQNNPSRMLWLMQTSIRPFVIHRNILEKMQFEARFNNVEDWHLLIRISLKYPIFILNKVLSVYVVHEERGTQRKFLHNIQENAIRELDCIEDLLLNCPQLKDQIPIEEKSDLVNHKVYGFASAAMKIRDFKLFWQLVRRFEWKGRKYKIIIYIISLFARLPMYLVTQYFGKR